MTSRHRLELLHAVLDCGGCSMNLANEARSSTSMFRKEAQVMLESVASLYRASPSYGADKSPGYEVRAYRITHYVAVLIRAAPLSLSLKAAPAPFDSGPPDNRQTALRIIVKRLDSLTNRIQSDSCNHQRHCLIFFSPHSPPSSSSSLYLWSLLVYHTLGPSTLTVRDPP